MRAEKKIMYFSMPREAFAVRKLSNVIKLFTKIINVKSIKKNMNKLLNFIFCLKNKQIKIKSIIIIFIFKIKLPIITEIGMNKNKYL